MKKQILFLLLVQYISLSAFSQYWQQKVDYTIAVSLNDNDHTLDGFESIDYTNNSPDTLQFIWFHLWPNAYKNDRTAFSEQLLENGSSSFYFSNTEDRGYINRLDFKVNNQTAVVEDHPQHIDIVKVVLPQPLAPGKKISINTSFHVKLPRNISRGGHDGQSYQATQWYPKPAVYDATGWHPMPYLNQGEFYSEFGSFDVTITLPKNYVVAATGELQNKAEKDWLKTRNNFNWEPLTIKQKDKTNIIKTHVQKFPTSANELKTLHFKQDSIHDFAWFADKRFVVHYDSCSLASGKVIDVYTYFLNQQEKIWQKSIQYCKNAIRHYSTFVGEYPYNIVSAVAGPESFAGGMEYPTITILSPVNQEELLEKIIVHEVGHNWFYGILASNERLHPWMDEGMNSFYESKYSEKNKNKSIGSYQQSLLEAVMTEQLDQPIATASENFSFVNYALIAYYKTSKWMEILEKEMGYETFQKGMHEYFTNWQFKHPQPIDFKIVMEKVSGKNLDAVFALLNNKGKLPNDEKKGFGFQGPMGLTLNRQVNKKTSITFLPAIGFNYTDKIMAGLTVTNLRLPHNKLQFAIVPQYAFGSKKMTGFGFANKSFFTNAVFRKIDVGVSINIFSYDKLKDNYNKELFLGMQKIVPKIKLTFKEKNARSSFYKYIQFKSFLIKEGDFDAHRDSIITPFDTTVLNRFTNSGSISRTLQQLQFVIENNRTLYSYSAVLRIEQGKGFIRPSFIGKYFFNYTSGGGMNVRFFAGKIFYTKAKTRIEKLAFDRYHFTLTGADGFEDYTYSDYFIGRNEFQGLLSQQIMIRDGAFKTRTNLLSNPVGKTDDWLMSINLSTTIPPRINPLNILPIKIPLKLFVDIGTYADAWKANANLDRFLFDAGLQVSLFKETLNIYFPLIYSNIFQEYVKSTIDKKGRFWKTISFSINTSNFNVRKISPILTF